MRWSPGRTSRPPPSRTRWRAGATPRPTLVRSRCPAAAGCWIRPRSETAAAGTPPVLADLAARLRGRRTLLLGESGMGKSTLLNALVPGADQQTAAISDALASGRHTTTYTRAFALPGGGWLLDSPEIGDRRGRDAAGARRPCREAPGQAHTAAGRKRHGQVDPAECAGPRGGPADRRHLGRAGERAPHHDLHSCVRAARRRLAAGFA